MEQTEWYIYRQGKQEGPFKQEQFVAMVESGSVDNDDYVWNARMTDWVTLEGIRSVLNINQANPEKASGEKETVKEQLISEIINFSDQGPFRISRSDETDLEITNEVTDSSWFSGNKKVVYNAQILFAEDERTAYFWEMLKESSSGISFQIGVQKRMVKGVELFQKIKERGFAPDGELVYDYQFDYSSLREAVRKIVQSKGWKFKVVLIKGKAGYR